MVGVEFLKYNYSPEQPPPPKVSAPDKALETLFREHCSGDIHHGQLLSFIGAANSIKVSLERCREFLIGKQNFISPDSSYYGNTSQLEATIKDIYTRYAAEHGAYRTELVYTSNGQEKKSAPKESESEFLARLESFNIQLNSDIQQPKARISIDGNVISTNGNLTVFAGASKSGKTGAMNSTIAQSLTDDPDFESLGFEVEKNIHKKLILHIDSEQSLYDHHRAIKGIIRRAGLSEQPEHFKSYNLRSIELNQRLAAVKLLLDTYADKFNGVFFVFIDGIADFVNSVNDEAEANEVIRFFERLAIQYDCPVITILHFNPNTEKGRGHIGSQLERKCESVLSVAKEKDNVYSVIEGKLLRNAGAIPTIQFCWSNDAGYHVSAGFKDKNADKSARFEKLKNDCEGFFEYGKKEMSYGELCSYFMDAENIKDRAAKSRVSELLTSGIIHYTDATKKRLKLFKNV